MTPTMSEYFGAWKNSRFIAGDKAEEKGFVATSRLLGHPRHPRRHRPDLRLASSRASRRSTPSRPRRPRTDLEKLHQFAGRLLTEEQGGKKFTASDADTLGSEAQRNAEAIAGQVSQAAGQLGLKLED